LGAARDDPAWSREQDDEARSGGTVVTHTVMTADIAVDVDQDERTMKALWFAIPAPPLWRH